MTDALRPLLGDSIDRIHRLMRRVVRHPCGAALLVTAVNTDLAGHGGADTRDVKWVPDSARIRVFPDFSRTGRVLRPDRPNE